MSFISPISGCYTNYKNLEDDDLVLDHVKAEGTDSRPFAFFFPENKTMDSQILIKHIEFRGMSSPRCSPFFFGNGKISSNSPFEYRVDPQNSKIVFFNTEPTDGIRSCYLVASNNFAYKFSDVLVNNGAAVHLTDVTNRLEDTVNVEMTDSQFTRIVNLTNQHIPTINIKAYGCSSFDGKGLTVDKCKAEMFEYASLKNIVVSKQCEIDALQANFVYIFTENNDVEVSVNAIGSSEVRVFSLERFGLDVYPGNPTCIIL